MGTLRGGPGLRGHLARALLSIDRRTLVRPVRLLALPDLVFPSLDALALQACLEPAASPAGLPRPRGGRAYTRGCAVCLAPHLSRLAAYGWGTDVERGVAGEARIDQDVRAGVRLRLLGLGVEVGQPRPVR